MIASNQPVSYRFAILWHTMPSDPQIASEGESLLNKNTSVITNPQPAARVSHFDLMLQFGDSLRTWELLRLPTEGEKCTVLRLPDHRLMYLDYEGPLSENRGHVIGWERGKAIWNSTEDHRMEILLFGDRLTAKLVLEAEEVDDYARNPTSPELSGWQLTAEIWQLADVTSSELTA